jgi:hypothetical protein
MKKIFLTVTIFAVLFSCNQTENKQENGENEKADSLSENVHLVLPKTLSDRQKEFESYIVKAMRNIKNFAHNYNWDKYADKPFIDSAMIFDNKKDFDREFLIMAGADTSIVLPKTYVGTIEKRTLFLVTPEMYAEAFPEGIEKNSYEKLITHEFAHRFHIRVLEGEENRMGPVWFFEGFAVFAADQFSETEVNLDKNEIFEIMNDPQRGNYIYYGKIFRLFEQVVPLQQLVDSAQNDNFNEWLYSKYPVKKMNN